MILFKIPAKTILGMLLVAVFLISGHGLAHEPSQGDQTSSPERELSAQAPDLAEIVPLATKLTGRLAALEKGIQGGLDIPAVENKYDGIDANLQDPAGRLQRLKDSKDYKYNKLVALREAIKQEYEMLEKISKPLNQAIQQLGGWRKEWLAEKKLWNEWRSSLLEEGELAQLKSAFEKANKTIDTALNLILPKLDAMLVVQEKGGHIQVKIDALTADLDSLIAEERRGALLDESPPMFSFQYFSQFGSGAMWYAVQKGLDDITWPDRRFFHRQGWAVLIQVFLSLVVIIAVYRKRQVLNGSERWRFLAARPFAAGFFLGCMTTLLIYEYGGAPAIWRLGNTIIAGISFARLVGGLIGTSWKRQFVYGLMIVLSITTLLEVLNFPLPLFRLYTVFTALVGLFFCLRAAGENRRHKGSGLHTGLLRLGSLLFAVILIAEVWGKKGLPSHIFVSLVDSIATVFVFMLFMYMIDGGLEWLFRKSPLRRAVVLYSDTDAIIRRVARLIDVAIWVLVLIPAVLMIWGVYDSLYKATKGLLAVGFNLGSQRISLGLLIVTAGIIYGAFLLSWVLQKLLMDEVLMRQRVERGVRHSIARMLHYLIIFTGFLLALSTLGFEITKLTIILSALGVGIGFGMQGIVNNFVSGLILLFERPVRVGDTIEVDGKWGTIKRIGLRSTTFQSFDNADVIIPNADLVSNQVTNWTLNNRRVRLIIPVGVAYGSDIPLVVETLMSCAKANSLVAETPEHQVLFLGFGESSLDFELRVWVMDVDVRLRVKSELHQEIDRRFREAKIEIAFPQRDLHLRSVDESVILRPQEKPDSNQ